MNASLHLRNYLRRDLLVLGEPRPPVHHAMTNRIGLAGRELSQPTRRVCQSLMSRSEVQFLRTESLSRWVLYLKRAVGLTDAVSETVQQSSLVTVSLDVETKLERRGSGIYNKYGLFRHQKTCFLARRALRFTTLT
jgi:hypothetical protein